MRLPIGAPDSVARRRGLLRQPRIAALAVLVALGATLLACSSNAGRTRQRSLDAVIRARGLDPAKVSRPDRLTPEIRRWLDERFPRKSHSEYDAYRLLQFLEDDELGLEYEAGYTGTAADVFATRKFNCLSFSHLYLAMAREIGVDASYLNVDRVRRFHRQGDVILVSGHVTVGFGVGLDRRVLEYDVGPEVSYKTAVPISDITALALHHSNRGAELIQTGRYGEAIEWLETGVRLDPSLAGIRVNLGVARRRSGDLDGAAREYLQAIDIDDEFLPAYRNLASLYKLRGDRDTAIELYAVLDRRGNRNPFGYLALGDQSLELGDHEEAKGYYRRALSLATDRSEPQAALGILALESGSIAEARHWLEKAIRSDRENERVARLERLLTAAADSVERHNPEPRIE